jgi:hypothetical protein
MTSIVDVTGRNAPAIMLIEAMARESKRDDLLEKFGVPKIPLNPSHVEVKLTINGVEVNFVKTAQEMWERLERRYRQDVEEAAKALIGRTRFEKLESILSRAEEQIEREVDQLLQEEQNEQRASDAR